MLLDPYLSASQVSLYWLLIMVWLLFKCLSAEITDFDILQAPTAP